jgi:hypothetical protein
MKNALKNRLIFHQAQENDLQEGEEAGVLGKSV